MAVIAKLTVLPQLEWRFAVLPLTGLVLVKLIIKGTTTVFLIATQSIRSGINKDKL